MSTKAIENELLALEKKYWQAIKDKDFEAAISMTDDPCIVSGAQGIGSIPRSAFEKMMKTPAYQLEEFKVDEDVKVRLLTTMWRSAYKVHEKLTVDGKPVTLDARTHRRDPAQRPLALCPAHRIDRRRPLRARSARPQVGHRRSPREAARCGASPDAQGRSSC